jgi:hypothetical protein
VEDAIPPEGRRAEVVKFPGHASDRTTLQRLSSRITKHIQDMGLLWLAPDGVELITADDGTPSIGIPLSRADTIIVTPENRINGRYAVLLSSVDNGLQVLRKASSADEVFDFFLKHVYPK